MFTEIFLKKAEIFSILRNKKKRPILLLDAFCINVLFLLFILLFCKEYDTV